MAFTTKRGRPPAPKPHIDLGTAELRLKHALGLTSEAIDRCLERGLITTQQHWCGMHLRWLYTLRYGAPSVTTRYADAADLPPRGEDDPIWRREREAEYRLAAETLQHHRFYEPVMRVCVHNEHPAFLCDATRAKAWERPEIAVQLDAAHRRLQHGLDVLVAHWKRR